MARFSYSFFFFFYSMFFFFFFFHLTLFMPDTQYCMKEIYRFYVYVYINRHIDVCLHTSAHTHTLTHSHTHTQIHTIFFRRRIQLTHEHDLCMQITEALKKQESPRIMTQHSSPISYTVSVNVQVSLMN